METKANYVAVGAFVLACVVGLVVTVLWLAGAQYSQEYAYYQAFFRGSVTGLGKGTVTRYNGIEVGRITDLDFDPTDPQRVIVTMQVRPNLNIREDSVASIDSQGLTGGAFVEITGGTSNAALLVAKEGQKYPVIRTKNGAFAELQKSAPEVVAKLNVAASRLNDLLNDNNRRAISQILANVNETTQVLARRSGDIDAIIANANRTMANFGDASASIKPTMQNVDLTVRKFGKVADDTDAFINGDGLAQLTDLIGEMRHLVGNLDQLTEKLNRRPTEILFGDRRKGYEPKDASSGGASK